MQSDNRAVGTVIRRLRDQKDMTQELLSELVAQIEREISGQDRFQ